MSHRLIGRSPDLQRLRNEGYDIEVRGGFVILKRIPYLTADLQVAYGTLVAPLDDEVRDGEQVAAKPTWHAVYWIGVWPHRHDGTEITSMFNPSEGQKLGNGLWVDHVFSLKSDYRDYHHKFLTYVSTMLGEVHEVDASVTATPFPVFAADDEEDVFKYIDTASSRAGIGAANEKLENLRIGIIGLGGTGAYVLDLIAKTRVRTIRLIDGDVFSSHNAFRSPGAASLEQLEGKPNKARHFAHQYEVLRNGIEVADVYVDKSNLDVLDDLDFAFLCLDRAAAKQDIVRRLEERGTPFIDVGMGVVRAPQGELSGLVRVTTSTPEVREHVWGGRGCFAEGDQEENEYSTNVQIAELNALNAALAVIRWKKHYGFYRNGGREHFCSYSIAFNQLANEEEV